MSNVLVVDDASASRAELGKIITTAGHRVSYAEDGDHGVAIAKQLKPDLVFMDTVMPGMNGFEACRKLKFDPATAKVPVVLVAPEGAGVDKTLGREQGADLLLSKPFKDAEVVSALKRLLDPTYRAVMPSGTAGASAPTLSQALKPVAPVGIPTTLKQEGGFGSKAGVIRLSKPVYEGDAGASTVVQIYVDGQQVGELPFAWTTVKKTELSMMKVDLDAMKLKDGQKVTFGFKR